MLHGKKIIVVMPAYHAEKTLAACYAAIPHDVVDEVLLVDDASDDATVAVAERLGIHAYRHPANRGYGGNQKTCYALALERGADIVVMLHPDYQYEPRLITAMAAMVASDVYDVVIGSRILGNTAIAGGMPRYKYVANRLLTCAAERAARLEAVGVPHGLSRVLAARAGDAAARAELRRFRVRQPDARAGARVRHARRRDLVSDALFRRSEPDQLPPLGRLRLRRAVDRRRVPPVEMETGQARVSFRRMLRCASSPASNLSALRRAHAEQRTFCRSRCAIARVAVACARACSRSSPAYGCASMQLRTQVLIDDEWHAVRMLIGSDAATIATHFGFADYCIPLTLYYRWLYDLGALSEWQMHLPLLRRRHRAAGRRAVAACVDRLAWPVRAVWIALLAISPRARLSQPHGAAVCARRVSCAFVAIIAFDRWRARAASRRWAAGVRRRDGRGGVAASSDDRVHAVAVRLVRRAGVARCIARPRAAPRARSCASSCSRSRRSPASRSCSCRRSLGDWHAMAAKAGAGAVERRDAVSRAADGVRHLESVALRRAALVLALGIWRVWTRDRRLHGIHLSTSVVGTVAIALSRPAWIQHPQTFVRYALPMLPFVLLFVAEGIVFVVAQLRLQALARAPSRCSRSSGSSWRVRFRGYYYFPNQLMGHALFQFDYDARRESVCDARRARRRCRRSIAISRRVRPAASR